MSRPCHVLRVFTRGDDGGNHLGVVNDLTGLSSAGMQQIATDLGFSETVFIDWDGSDARPAVRIFTPASELPFAGHPLVGAAWALSNLGAGTVGTIDTAVGRTDFEVNGASVSVRCSIPITTIEPNVVAAAAVSAGMPVPVATRILGLPKEYLIAEYASFNEVEALDPDLDAFLDHFGLLCFARDGAEVKSRFFVPGEGIPEDPATGSAAVALAWEFILRGELEGVVSVRQGDEIGHPSTIHLAWDAAGTTIGGTVVRDEVRLLP